MSRKIIFILVFCLIVGLVPSITYGSNTFTPNREVTIKKYNWEPFMRAIIAVESEGDVNAKNGNCIGPMQISPIMVAECNDILKKRKSKKRFSLSDRKNISKAKEMFILIQEHFNPEHNLKKAARIWNAGPYSKPGTAKKYIEKVMTKYRSL